MSFPNLVLTPNILAGPGALMPYSAEATGVPDPGVNVIALPFVAAGIPPNQIDPTRLKIYFDPDPSRLLPGVTDVRFVSLAADKSTISLTFAQTAPGVGNCRILIEVDHTIEGVSSTGTPLIFGSSGAGGGPSPSAGVQTALPYVGLLVVTDAVYVNGGGSYALADASLVATSQVVGIVSAVDSPAVGQATIITSGRSVGFVGLTPGARYVLSTTPGVLLAETDTLNPAYPSAPGEALIPVGVALTFTDMLVNVSDYMLIL